MFDNYTPGEILRRGPRFVLKTGRRLAIRQYMRGYFASYPAHPSKSRDGAVAITRDAESVLFLCWGNVCRSPFAERYARMRCHERQLDFTTKSAGVGESQGRGSPPSAIDAAADFGVDLSSHCSARISPSSINESDVVFVMDYNNYYSVIKACDDAAYKTFFLGALNDADSVQIGDPFGRGVDQFLGTYGHIATAIDELLDAVDPAVTVTEDGV